MKLWMISQNENDDYDTFDSAVVAAETEADARHMSPADIWMSPGHIRSDAEREDNKRCYWTSNVDAVTVRLLGEAAPGMEAEIICASFNAG